VLAISEQGNGVFSLLVEGTAADEVFLHSGSVAWTKNTGASDVTPYNVYEIAGTQAVIAIADEIVIQLPA
jgi:hypothetical protein